MLLVPGYAALRLVTSYAAPWLRHARISLGSLQTWWSERAATVRFIETAARFTWKRHGLCSSVSGLLQVDMSCVVVDVLVNVRSNKIRQETVCPCCLTCQLLRFLDLVVEQLVEVGDEIAGGGLLNDVADLLRQVH